MNYLEVLYVYLFLQTLKQGLTVAFGRFALLRPEVMIKLWFLMTWEHHPNVSLQPDPGTPLSHHISQFSFSNDHILRLGYLDYLDLL